LVVAAGSFPYEFARIAYEKSRVLREILSEYTSKEANDASRVST